MNPVRSTVALIAFLVLDVAARADVPLTYATIEPAQITLGDSARFTITTLGNVNEPFTLPVVPGLQFQIVGRTHQFEIINGTTLTSSSIVVRVTPQIAGIFTIPAVTPKSQPLVLQVTDHATANGNQFVNPKAPSQPTTQPPVPPILSGAAVPNGIHLTEDGSAFVRLIGPKRDVYVGEKVPVEIELGMRSGFVSALKGPPKLSSDEFTLDLSRQPERSEKTIAGEPFVVLTWQSAITVVKPGTFSLSAETPLTVRIRTRPRSETRVDDLFGDPFLQNFFGATIPKDITAVSPPMELKVLALPSEGRPADFHGAVGSFKIASEISPPTAAAGEPLTLRLRVTGSGSFDRVDSPMLGHLDDWKTYPPTSSLMLSEGGAKGEKTFEQPLIAAKPGIKTLPGLTFSYFDPSAHRYETLHTDPLRVTVSPALAESTPTAPATAGAVPVDKSSSGLKPDHAADESPADSLIPLYLQPRFLALPSLLALAFAAGWWGVRRRRDAKASRAMDRETSKDIRRLLEQMDAASMAGDAESFFNAARSALQKALAARWEVAPDEITTADVGTRLDRNAEAIRRLFALADETKYSGHELSGTDFSRWRKVVRHQLELEKAL